MTPDKFAGAEPIVIDNVQGLESKRRFTATMPVGQSSVTVPHGLFSVPSYVFAFPTHRELAGLRCASRTDTALIFECDEAVTVARGFDVLAERRP